MPSPSTSLKPLSPNLNVEEAVRQRYSEASREKAPALCCPVEYDPRYLKLLPAEILERDYGCGDPSRWLTSGDTVLDLGSGGGKICYIAAQVVGAKGKVIGVDCNDDMLQLARKYQAEMGDKLGYQNVEFRKGRIQDLGLDLELLDKHLQEHPVRDGNGWLNLEETTRRLRRESPLLADESVDVVVSNCVLNLVRHEDRTQLFAELYRVLKTGGRAVISDITCDEPVPLHLQNDPNLWSGCLSGAHLESEFLAAFEQAGFHGIEIVERAEEPWATISGIEFRGLTLRAWKGKEGPCLERNQALIYAGPWKSVEDDAGQVFQRGVRTAVCDKTYRLLSQVPYAGQMLSVAPHQEIPLENALPFPCHETKIRDPRQTKGINYQLTQLPDGGCCGSDGCC